jgi:Xaa-Pro aminopeptidase
MNDAARSAEVAAKVELIQRGLGKGRALRLRGVDWFSWVTAGGSSTVLLAAETGVAEVVVTSGGGWVVTDEIEAQRLSDEQIPAGLPIKATSWAHRAERERLVKELAPGCRVLSDRPRLGEELLPQELVAAKRTLSAPEIGRYRRVGRLAAEAMTQALNEARPDWNEYQLAAAGGAALMARGLDPALVMAAGERRMRIYRHPVSAGEPLGAVAMMVFCARGAGLYANLTRFVSFGPLSEPLKKLHRQAQEVETKALALSRPGTTLGEVYHALALAYAAAGDESAIREHHQGGTTGYLSREVIATPESAEPIRVGTAVAWNPSLRGAKVEDTFLVTEGGLLNLTMDPAWPTAKVGELNRPLVLER